MLHSNPAKCPYVQDIGYGILVMSNHTFTRRPESFSSSRCSEMSLEAGIERGVRQLPGVAVKEPTRTASTLSKNCGANMSVNFRYTPRLASSVNPRYVLHFFQLIRKKGAMIHCKVTWESSNRCSVQVCYATKKVAKHIQVPNPKQRQPPHWEKRL